MDNQLTTSKRLHELIEEKHITYTEMERLTGVPKSAIQRYASGETKKIPLDRIFRIAQALGVSPYDIVRMDRPWGEDQHLTPEWEKWQAMQSYNQETPSLVQDEIELVMIYRDLNDIGQSALIGTARGLAANPEMNRHTT